MTELFRVLQPTDAEFHGIGEIDPHDDSFDQDLGQQHIHFGNDVGDHLHILFVGEDDQGVGTFIGNDARIGQQLKFGSTGGPVDDLLQTLLKRRSARSGSRLGAAKLLEWLTGLRLAQSSRAGTGAVSAVAAAHAGGGARPRKLAGLPLRGSSRARADAAAT